MRASEISYRSTCFPQDQVQQQVERALVDLGRHLVRHGSRVPADTLATVASPPAPDWAGPNATRREARPRH